MGLRILRILFGILNCPLILYGAGSFANDGSFLQDFEAESRHESNVRQKREGDHGDDRDRPGGSTREAERAAPFKKPLDPSKMLGLLQSLAGDAESKPAQEHPAAPSVSYTPEDANKLAAEAVRAKLLGDMDRHATLMAKLERVKQGGGNGQGNDRGQRGQPAGASAAQKAMGASNEEVVIISELDADGESTSAAVSRSTSVGPVCVNTADSLSTRILAVIFHRSAAREEARSSASWQPARPRSRSP